MFVVVYRYISSTAIGPVQHLEVQASTHEEARSKALRVILADYAYEELACTIEAVVQF